MMAGTKTTILTADDDPQLLRLVQRNLQMEGYEVLVASDGQQALELLAAQPDLVLLDVMMPRLDGFTTCQRIRECSTVPIIMLTADARDQDKALGLNLGADDYLSKPFDVEELLARIRAVFRRGEGDTNPSPFHLVSIITLGDLTVDVKQCQVRKAGKQVALTSLEYRIISYLAQHAGRVVPKESLLEYAWGEDYRATPHLLQVNINRLRRKLETDPAHPRYLLTKPGIGYVLSSGEDGSHGSDRKRAVCTPMN